MRLRGDSDLIEHLSREREHLLALKSEEAHVPSKAKSLLPNGARVLVLGEERVHS